MAQIVNESHHEKEGRYSTCPQQTGVNQDYTNLNKLRRGMVNISLQAWNGMRLLCPAVYNLPDFVCRPRQHSRQVATRTSSRNEFGGPHRRVTDFLLVLNAAAFIAQIVSKDRLLLLGAKVLLLCPY